MTEEIQKPQENDSSGRSRKTKRQWAPWIAVGAAVAVVGWMASGMLEEAPPVQRSAPKATASKAVAVQIAVSEVSAVTRFIVSQAEVWPNRTAILRAQTAGQVVALQQQRGTLLQAGDLVVELDEGDRPARLAQAEAVLIQRQRDYSAAQKLMKNNNVTEARLAENFAQMQAAEAAVKQIREEIADTMITAPFEGSLNRLSVELGEAVTVGGELAQVVDNDPLKVHVQIPQQKIGDVRPEQEATVRFISGAERTGKVTFVSATANQQTRTFPVEIQVPNPDRSLPSGTSAEVRLPTGEVPAHFVSPAIMALNTSGVLGVKTVDSDDRVQFFPVEVVRAETDGVWVSGLPDRVRLITVGQGFVNEGAKVRPVEQKPDGADPQGTADRSSREPNGSSQVTYNAVDRN